MSTDEPLRHLLTALVTRGYESGIVYERHVLASAHPSVREELPRAELARNCFIDGYGSAIVALSGVLGLPFTQEQVVAECMRIRDRVFVGPQRPPEVHAEPRKTTSPSAGGVA